MPIIVVGGGLGGLELSIGLHKQGFPVTVIDPRLDHSTRGGLIVFDSKLLNETIGSPNLVKGDEHGYGPNYIQSPLNQAQRTLFAHAEELKIPMSNHKFERVVPGGIEVSYPGCDVHLVQNPKKFPDEYENSYLVTKGDHPKVFYVQNKRAIRVLIHNIERFKKSLSDMMRNKDHLCLTQEQIQQLITSNGGHKPTPKAKSFMPTELVIDCTGTTRSVLKDANRIAKENKEAEPFIIETAAINPLPRRMLSHGKMEKSDFDLWDNKPNKWDPYPKTAVDVLALHDLREQFGWTEFTFPSFTILDTNSKKNKFVVHLHVPENLPEEKAQLWLQANLKMQLRKSNVPFTPRDNASRKYGHKPRQTIFRVQPKKVTNLLWQRKGFPDVTHLCSIDPEPDTSQGLTERVKEISALLASFKLSKTRGVKLDLQYFQEEAAKSIAELVKEQKQVYSELEENALNAAKHIVAKYQDMLKELKSTDDQWKLCRIYVDAAMKVSLKYLHDDYGQHNFKKTFSAIAFAMRSLKDHYASDAVLEPLNKKYQQYLAVVRETEIYLCPAVKLADLSEMSETEIKRFLTSCPADVLREVIPNGFMLGSFLKLFSTQKIREEVFATLLNLLGDDYAQNMKTFLAQHRKEDQMDFLMRVDDACEPIGEWKTVLNTVPEKERFDFLTQQVGIEAMRYSVASGWKLCSVLEILKERSTDFLKWLGDHHIRKIVKDKHCLEWVLNELQTHCANPEVHVIAFLNQLGTEHLRKIIPTKDEFISVFCHFSKYGLGNSSELTREHFLNLLGKNHLRSFIKDVSTLEQFLLGTPEKFQNHFLKYLGADILRPIFVGENQANPDFAAIITQINSRGEPELEKGLLLALDIAFPNRRSAIKLGLFGGDSVQAASPSEAKKFGTCRERPMREDRRAKVKIA